MYATRPYQKEVKARQNWIDELTRRQYSLLGDKAWYPGKPSQADIDKGMQELEARKAAFLAEQKKRDARSKARATRNPKA